MIFFHLFQEWNLMLNEFFNGCLKWFLSLWYSLSSWSTLLVCSAPRVSGLWRSFKWVLRTNVQFFSVTSVAGSASYLTSQLVSIIHPMAWVSRWSCCPDLSRLIVQNSNTPGLSYPRVGASWGSSPTQWQKFKLLVSPLISTVTSLIHRKYLLDVHLCNLAHSILLLTRVLGLQIDKRSDEKFRQGFIALPAIAEGSKNK